MVALIDSGLVSSIPDLYKLTVEEVARLERFADLSATNLINAIATTKNPPLNKFITALGIRHVGAQTATSLARKFETMDNLISVTEDELLSVNDIGEVVAESILAYFGDEENIKMLNELKSLGVWPQDEKDVGLPLTGHSYVVTGTLASMGREEAEDKLRSLGATVTSSVTKNTTALIVGDKPGNSKIEKANRFGIRKIGEEEFIKLIPG